MIGTMPLEMIGGNCNTIIKENMIPVTIEVCGLEKIKLTSPDAFT